MGLCLTLYQKRGDILKMNNGLAHLNPTLNIFRCCALRLTTSTFMKLNPRWRVKKLDKNAKKNDRPKLVKLEFEIKMFTALRVVFLTLGKRFSKLNPSHS